MSMDIDYEHSNESGKNKSKEQTTGNASLGKRQETSPVALI